VVANISSRPESRSRAVCIGLRAVEPLFAALVSYPGWYDEPPASLSMPLFRFAREVFSSASAGNGATSAIVRGHPRIAIAQVAKLCGELWVRDRAVSEDLADQYLRLVASCASGEARGQRRLPPDDLVHAGVLSDPESAGIHFTEWMGVVEATIRGGSPLRFVDSARKPEDHESMRRFAAQMVSDGMEGSAAGASLAIAARLISEDQGDRRLIPYFALARIAARTKSFRCVTARSPEFHRTLWGDTDTEAIASACLDAGKALAGNTRDLYLLAAAIRETGGYVMRRMGREAKVLREMLGGVPTGNARKNICLNYAGGWQVASEEIKTYVDAIISDIADGGGIVPDVSIVNASARIRRALEVFEIMPVRGREWLYASEHAFVGTLLSAATSTAREMSGGSKEAGQAWLRTLSRVVAAAIPVQYEEMAQSLRDRSRGNREALRISHPDGMLASRCVRVMGNVALGINRALDGLAAPESGEEPEIPITAPFEPTAFRQREV